MGYRGTHKQKKVTKLAPDAVIRINGEMSVEICPSCNTKIDITKYVTSLTTSLANNTTIGNAQFNIAMPRHGDNGIYMVRGGKVHGINLMDEVEIFMKARFLSSDNTYKYHKVFWGVVVNIGESYGSGEQGIAVNCESMLKWLQLMKTNEHPSIMALADTKEKIDLKTLFWSGKSYANKNPYQIIYSLVNVTMLNMVIPSVLDTEKFTIDVGNEKISKRVAVGKGSFPAAKDLDLLKKWENKFASIKSSLKMFGTTEESFIDINDSNQAERKTTTNPAMAASASKNSPIQINYNTRALMDFRPFIKPNEANTEIDLVSNSYKNNLEIASEVKVYTGFEFYLDTTGDIIFKPPFWNLDTSENEVFRIKDEDIINWDFRDSEESVVTRIEVTGAHSQTVNIDSYLVPRGIFTNYNLARHFGMRTEQISMKYFTTPNMCYYHAISEMDRINANKYKGSVTIVGRPEIRLGLPVYIESRDIFGYVENVNHNFTFGGPFTTSLQLSAIRKKYLGEDSMSDGHDLSKVDDSYRAYNYKGDPAILLYKGEDDTEFIDRVRLNNPDLAKKIESAAAKKATEQTKKASDSTLVKKGGSLKTNRAGVYEEVKLSHPNAQKLLAKLDIAKSTNNRDTYLDFLEQAIPVSDEDGYELIGIYENGRSLYLDPKGTIKKRGSSFSQILKNKLDKATKGNHTFIDPGFTEIKVKTDPTSNSHIKDDDGVDKRSNTDKGVRDYFKDKAISLRELRPKDDTSSTRGCSCLPSDLTGLSTRDRLGVQSKQRVISKAKVNRKK